MRISDWCSDVCSSDLRHDMLRAVIGSDGLQRILPEVPYYRFEVLDLRGQPAAEDALLQRRLTLAERLVDPDTRSAERRGGEEWVSTCRSWWAPYPDKRQRCSEYSNRTQL